MSLFWGIVLAGIGAYTMRASFVLLLSGVSFPDRVIRILDHVGRHGRTRCHNPYRVGRSAGSGSH